MSQNTSSFIKIIAGAFSACMVVVCGMSIWFISAHGSQPWASLWLGAALFTLLCLFGLVIIILLDLFFRRPLAALSEFTANILSGNYPAAALPSSRYNSLLESSVGELADNYKKRLGFSRSILEGLPIPCCIVDTEQRITFLNSECLDMIGSTAAPEIYHGRMISQIFYKDDRKALIGTCMDDDTRAMNREAVFKHASGSDIHVVANLFPLHDVEGKVIGGCCLYMDTTELKERQEQILEQGRCISTAAQEAEGVALELTVAADQLKGLVEAAKHGAREQARRTGETATAMEEMNASILEVAGHAQDASENAHDARVRAEEGALTVKEVVGAIEEVAGHATALKASMDDLDERTEGIGKVLSVIEDIADQTNLLALNAAIEAARAGEAGRGFAVVADEVRKLAEKTMLATTEVHTAVSGIQEGARANARATETAVVSIHKSTDMASHSGEVLAQIVAVSETTAERVRAIAAAAGQQSAASDQINQATVEVNRISSDTDEAMAESTDAITRLSNLAQRLSGVIGGMRNQDA